MKTCNICNIEKELSEFYKDKRSKDFFNSICKTCKKEKDKVYYSKNRSKIIKKASSYYLENCEKIKQYSKNRNKRLSKIDWGDISKIEIECRVCKIKKNSSEIASNKSKKYGKDSVCKKCHVMEVSSYYENNYEVRKAQRSRRKNKIRQAGGLAKSKDLILLKEYNIKTFGVLTCEYCLNQVKDDYYDLEHILAIANGGNSDLDNLAISCRECNGAKSNKFLEEFAPDKLEYFKNRKIV